MTQTLSSEVRLVRYAVAELRSLVKTAPLLVAEPDFKLAVADWLDDALNAHLEGRPGNYPSWLKAVAVAKTVVGEA